MGAPYIYDISHLRVKPRAQILTCDTEHIFELLDPSDQELMLDHLFDILKQCALARVEELELEPEPKERIVTVLKLTEAL
jgi:hypothetical protein